MYNWEKYSFNSNNFWYSRERKFFLFISWVNLWNPPCYIDFIGRNKLLMELSLSMITAIISIIQQTFRNWIRRQHRTRSFSYLIVTDITKVKEMSQSRLNTCRQMYAVHKFQSQSGKPMTVSKRQILTFQYSWNGCFQDFIICLKSKSNSNFWINIKWN